MAIKTERSKSPWKGFNSECREHRRPFQKQTQASLLRAKWLSGQQVAVISHAKVQRQITSDQNQPPLALLGMKHIASPSFARISSRLDGDE